MAITLSDMKLRLRVSGSAFDSEIAALIAQANEDIAATGILDGGLQEDLAVEYYCKAHFGYEDINNQAQYLKIYQSILAKLASRTDCITEVET